MAHPWRWSAWSRNCKRQNTSGVAHLSLVTANPEAEAGRAAAVFVGPDRAPGRRRSWRRQQEQAASSSRAAPMERPVILNSPSSANGHADAPASELAYAEPVLPSRLLICS